jgi:hypothetical protein
VQGPQLFPIQSHSWHAMVDAVLLITVHCLPQGCGRSRCTSRLQVQADSSACWASCVSAPA